MSARADGVPAAAQVHLKKICRKRFAFAPECGIIIIAAVVAAAAGNAAERLPLREEG